MSDSWPVERRNGERRAPRRRHRWLERRSGFDRRASDNGLAGRYTSFLLAYRTNSRALFLVLAIITLLNFADLLLTVRALSLGAVEGNPLMAALFDISPVLAGVLKMTIGMVVVEVIWAWRRYRRVLEFSMLLLGGMMLLFIYHLTLAARIGV